MQAADIHFEEPNIFEGGWGRRPREVANAAGNVDLSRFDQGMYNQ